MVDAADPAPRVLLGVSGGIAAYKAPALVRALTGAGAEVQVIMTPAAQAFTTPMSLSTVSRRPVRTAVLDASEEGQVGHIELADWPDLVLVAPATADVMARAAHGLADDLLTTVLLATRAPVLWAPAMNTNMWRHPATQANLATLASRGAAFVGPDRGELACGWVGEGRMIDPPIIVARALELCRDPASARSWAGRRVLVSAGPTRAYLDPVRFLTNASTGAMGFGLAEVAARRGAAVTLVAGPVQRATPAGVERIDVETADQMLTAMDRCLRESPVDLVAMVAAVADLAPRHPSTGKLDKVALTRAMDGAAWTEGVDVLATLCQHHAERTFFLGFGAQTVDEGQDVRARLVDAGRRKLERKGCHAIFVNRVGVPGTGFASATNTGLLVYCASGRDGTEGRDGGVEDAGPPMPKDRLAGWMLDRLRARIEEAPE
ncbi:MAG: bifunctional phosphopantothenoylcysteine decarboxylase/phosphopantothenate--cysteine ligase CoaBC [Myxococcota bacterium]